jgi:hypothetical protein
MKFCGECAAPLAATCPSCGAANPPENKFCGQCAASLRITPTARVPAPDSHTPKHLAEKVLTSKPALDGERKQVTVLFPDLKGSTASAMTHDRQQIMAAGFDGYQAKPIDVTQFVAAVRQAVDQPAEGLIR